MRLRRIVDGKAVVGGQIRHQANLGNPIRFSNAEAFDFLLSAPANHGFVMIAGHFRDLRGGHHIGIVAENGFKGGPQLFLHQRGMNARAVFRGFSLVPASRRQTGIGVFVARFQKRNSIRRSNGVFPGFLPGVNTGDDSVFQIVLRCLFGDFAEGIKLLFGDEFRVGIQYPLVLLKVTRTAGTPLQSMRGREEVSLCPCSIVAPCQP